MLQKGFLKPREKGSSRIIKISRVFLFAGIIIVFFALGAAVISSGEPLRLAQYASAWFPMMIVGFCLVFISIWMNFFAQNRRR
ncbi:MAG: hypothetical protein LBL24_10980 [Bacteroidales bacterium]|jgi:Na+/proline symporter|nr:hypothetical protein [Bacteroidales bacterium]